MKTQYSAVLFDLDGTLIDTAADFIACLNQLLTLKGKSPLAADKIRTVVSDGARAMITLAFNINEGEEGFESLKQQFLDMYIENIATHSRLFNSLDELINWCQQQNIPWGIVTNKPRKYSEPLLKALGLDNGISSLVCPDDVTNPKPHPEPMLKACKEMSINSQNCLYVGDHARDIKAGKNAQMKTVAAGYGYVHDKFEAQKWQADWTVNSSEDLTALLKTLLSPADKSPC